MKHLNDRDIIYVMAQQAYRKVPYHNFQHAQIVKNAALDIFDVVEKTRPDILEEEIQEINAKDMNELRELLEIAALYHDVGRLYMPLDHDEKKSAILAWRILEKLAYPKKKIMYVKKLILATIFKNRWEIKNVVWKILADADIAKSVASDVEFFVRDNARLLIESLDQDKLLTKDMILEYMKWKKNFIGYLTGITWNKDQPFLMEETNKVFPNFVKVRDEYFKKLEENPDYFIDLTRQEWSNFYWNYLILLDEIWE